MKKTDNQPLIDSFVDSYALVEWEPKRPGLIYGLVRYNTIYKVGQFYHHLQNSYPYHLKLLHKGDHNVWLQFLINLIKKTAGFNNVTVTSNLIHSVLIEKKLKVI